jgi:outer membrane protein
MEDSMKKASLFLTTALLLGSFCTAEAADMSVGFVNFKTCVENSKQGQQEKIAFDALKKQMTEAIEKTNKQLEETAKKLEDQDYMDSLSPTAEGELKQKFQLLSQEYGRCQNQYYQLLNQENFKMLQNLHNAVSRAAQKVCLERHLGLILNEDSSFAHSASLDLTDEVVTQMNKEYEMVAHNPSSPSAKEG